MSPWINRLQTLSGASPVQHQIYKTANLPKLYYCSIALHRMWDLHWAVDCIALQKFAGSHVPPDSAILLHRNVLSLHKSVLDSS